LVIAAINQAFLVVDLHTFLAAFGIINIAKCIRILYAV